MSNNADADARFVRRVQAWLASQYGEDLGHPDCPPELRAAVLGRMGEFTVSRSAPEGIIVRLPAANFRPSNPTRCWCGAPATRLRAVTSAAGGAVYYGCDDHPPE